MIHYINNMLHKFTNLCRSQESYISVLWSPMVFGNLLEDLWGYIIGLIHYTSLPRYKKIIATYQWTRSSQLFSNWIVKIMSSRAETIFSLIFYFFFFLLFFFCGGFRLLFASSRRSSVRPFLIMLIISSNLSNATIRTPKVCKYRSEDMTY